MNSQNELSRFLIAQENTYATALKEIKNAEKKSHWMWFIFPQIKGLGTTEMSVKYSINNISEAESYLNHPILGQRLNEITGELLKLKGKSAAEIFGSPDYKKLKSCMTLFSIVSGEPNIFNKVLDQYYNGEKDEKTLAIISANK
ncbi:DUF1810 domain-containing protein [Daejeonella oryzae]|uniref:DUF1810 domain-containing protein n=1 Tax=Daejeonella oryzae TaxID=1122943 RepID=UPI0004034161|nr:DUF1810 domain-containing protein [Daejeonella oryzae]